MKLIRHGVEIMPRGFFARRGNARATRRQQPNGRQRNGQGKSNFLFHAILPFDFGFGNRRDISRQNDKKFLGAETRGGKSAPARDTPQAFSLEESDQTGAIAGVERRGRRLENGRDSGNGRWLRNQRWQEKYLRRKRNLICRRDANRRGGGGRIRILRRGAAGHFAAAMAASAGFHRRGARHCWRGEQVRQRQQEATEDDRDRFHRFLFFVRLADFGDVFVRIFVEVLFAGLATQLHFLIFVSEDKRLAHVAIQFFAGDGAGLEQIRLGFGGGFGVLGVNGQPGDGRERGKQ
jgi:hypothetical protein